MSNSGNQQQKPQTVAPTQTRSAAPKLKMRNAAKIMHHLFKCALGTFAKDLSWTKGKPNLAKIEHVHHYHSVNSMGMPQKYTTTVGNHFHEVKWNIGPDGEPVASCGPAMRKVTKNTVNGTVTKVEPLRFLDMTDAEEDDQGNVRGKWVIDDHEHSMEYLGTDELMPAGARQQAALPSMPATPKVPEGFSMVDGGPRTPAKAE